MSDFDSPWKEALERYLPWFLAFFFPEIHADIDWSRGYESLDKELQQVAHDAELGLRLADKLFRVWRRNGEEAWVLIHIEVQNQPDDDFAERMYVYNYRLYDRFRKPVVSLAVLGDERTTWRPNEFGYDLWGCTILLKFPVVKLLDYAQDLAALETATNPFGLIVLAHLQTMATRRDALERRLWKTRLVKGLFDRGLEADAIRQLFRLIDWMMDLPRELDKQFTEEIRQYEEEKKMPYVTSVERLALERGREEGLEKGREEGETLGLQQGIAFALENKFGPVGLELLPAIERIKELAVLRQLWEAIRSGCNVEDLRKLLQ